MKYIFLEKQKVVLRLKFRKNQKETTASALKSVSVLLQDGCQGILRFRCRMKHTPSGVFINYCVFLIQKKKKEKHTPTSVHCHIKPYSCTDTQQ